MPTSKDDRRSIFVRAIGRSSAGSQHCVSECGDVLRVGEEASVSGDSSENAGVFVLNFTLDDAVAESLVIGGGWDIGAEFRRRFESSVSQGQWAEDFALTETVERFIGQALHGDAEEDESDVAVFDVRAGVIGKRHGKGGCEKFVASAGAEKKFLVGGEARGMSQQHAEGDFVATGILAGEFSDNRDQGQVEVEQTALIEDHCHRGRGNHLGEGSKVEKGCGHWFKGGRIVGETAKGAESQQLITVGDRDGCGREGAGHNCIFEDAKSVSKTGILVVVGGNRCGMGQKTSLVAGVSGYSKECGCGKGNGP